MISNCFKIVFPLQVGVQEDTLEIVFPILNAKGEIDVWPPGRHFVGPYVDFVKFPTTWTTVQFTGNTSQGDRDRQQLSARTRDGLRVHIEGSFQYKLKLDGKDLVQLYKNFGKPKEDENVRPYEDAFMRFAGDSIRNVAANFTSFQFFSNRTLISSQMESAINETISGVLGVHCKSFQLLSVDLPDEFDSALQRTEVARQAIVQADYQQKTADIQARTAVIEAGNDGKILELQARARAKSYGLQVDAELGAL